MNLRRIFLVSLTTAIAAIVFAEAAAQTASSASTTPLPNSDQLLKRAIANESKLAAEQERYQCHVSDEITELDSKDKVKHTSIELKEQFYVNGNVVERTLAKDGKNLTPEQTQKEDHRVMKETLKYSARPPAGKEPGRQSKVRQMMTAMILTNGRRDWIDGRSVLFYDIVPDPKFHATSMNERLAQVMQGKISIDEQTGEPIDIDMRSTRDLRIAGGVLATVHKGLWMHLHHHPQPDGVWVMDLFEGSGDARAALFMHPYFRFKETTADCRLFTVTANQVAQDKPVK